MTQMFNYPLNQQSGIQQSLDSMIINSMTLEFNILWIQQFNDIEFQFNNPWIQQHLDSTTLGFNNTRIQQYSDSTTPNGSPR